MVRQSTNTKKNEALENKNGFWVGEAIPFRLMVLKLRMKILSNNHASNHPNAQKTT